MLWTQSDRTLLALYAAHEQVDQFVLDLSIGEMSLLSSDIVQISLITLCTFYRKAFANVTSVASLDLKGGIKQK